MPGEAETVFDFNRAVHAAASVRCVKHARVGLIGDHAPGFLNMAVDAAVLQKILGTRLIRFHLTAFINLVRSMPEKEVAEDVKKAKALKLPVRGDLQMTDEVWDISSRYYLAIKQMVVEENLDAVALRCWPELPNEVGVWPYLALARIASDGIAICEEGDVDGAIACLMAKSLGCEIPAFNSDWIEHDDNGLTLWHSGATPFQICDPIGTPEGPTLAVHFNSRKPVVVDARLLDGTPVTLFRFWHVGDRYRVATVEGTLSKNCRKIEGCYARVDVPGGGVKRFFEDACLRGMPHHVAVIKGHYANTIRQIAERYGTTPIEVAAYV
jgi:L-fucose isomerase-like protein